MEFLFIQYLRAAAAIAVVFFHTKLQLDRMGYMGPWPTWLSSGVDVFFVISGFIMMMTTFGKSITPYEFYKRRAARIVPLYWILTTLMVVVQFVSPAVLQSSRFELFHVLASYLFIPWNHPVLGDNVPVLVPGWTLNYEMFFYLIFGGTLLLKERHRVPILVGLLAALAAVGFVLPEKRTILDFYTTDIVLDFGFGVLIAYGFIKGIRLPAIWGWVSLAIGLAWIAFMHLDGIPRAFAVGIPAALIVIGAIGVEASSGVKRLWLPHFLGDASYSIYLSHGIVLSAMSQIWRKLGLADGDFLAFTAVAVSSACFAGGVLYVVIERPIQKLIKRQGMPVRLSPA